MEEKDVKVKVVKAQHPSQLNPNEIILNNARALVTLPTERRDKVIKMQLSVILTTLFPEEDGKEARDFTADVAAMLRAQIGLITLSTAIEYWMAKERQGRIKVYAANEMPKA